MNVRIQTWFPFNIQICLNGREWLARQLAAEGCTDFLRYNNCFTRLGDLPLGTGQSGDFCGTVVPVPVPVPDALTH